VPSLPQAPIPSATVATATIAARRPIRILLTPP
jgi:hypothetical protein